jgi:hypothetical protein
VARKVILHDGPVGRGSARAAAWDAGLVNTELAGTQGQQVMLIRNTIQSHNQEIR